MGLCRCCLVQGSFKSMQSGNTINGRSESCAEMLRATFNITLSQILEPVKSDILICTTCEDSLQNAFAFKQQILQSEEVLLKKTKIKFEVEISPQDQEVELKMEYGMAKCEAIHFNSDADDHKDSSLLDMTRENPPLKSRTKALHNKKIRKRKDSIKLKRSTKIKLEEANDNSVRFKCRSCSEHFALKKQLNEHYKSLHALLKCTFCPKMLHRNVASVLKHMRKVHDLEMFKNDKKFTSNCEICASRYSSCEAKVKHVKKIHHQCDKCFKIFRNMYEMEQHKKMHSADCNICNKVFPSNSLLKVHMLQDHNTCHFYTCKICKVSVTSMRDLLKHKVDSHGAPVFNCGACDNIYYQQSWLIKHQRRSHLMEREFPCTQCEYKAFNSSKLKRHMISHSSVKSYECEYCKKKFARRTTLRMHERIHTGDKRQTCKLCGAAFVQRASLKYHLDKQHQGQIVD